MTRRTSVALATLMVVLAWGPIGAAHLAQNDAARGSPTSYGFGGLADPDPCRRESQQEQLPGVPAELPGDACSPSNGVAGTYVAATSVTAVECLGNADDAALPNGTHADCDSLVFAGGWRGLATAICDLEVGLLDGTDLPLVENPDDETLVDNSAEPGGTVPDGTWDDGGLGGACHVSTYHGGPINNANTNPPNPDNNALTKCEGTAYAEDWVLGADVPILVSCDFAEFGPVPFPPPPLVPGLVTCTSGPTLEDAVDCAINNVTQGIDQIVNPPEPPFASCTRDSVMDVTHLGKGGGHVGYGVTVPNVTDLDNATLRTTAVNNCETTVNGQTFVPGDIVVFVSHLVSANRFGQAYDDERDDAHDPVDEHFGWPIDAVDADAQLVSNWDGDGQVDGTGDTVVYPATGGWIDHAFASG